MNVRPLRDRILVKRVEEQEQRLGEIIVPDAAKGKPQTAKVVAVGNGRVNDKGQVFPLDVKATDYVLVGKYAGTEITLNGEEYASVDLPALTRLWSKCLNPRRFHGGSDPRLVTSLSTFIQ